jgi:S1-C subfamily serine protease
MAKFLGLGLVALLFAQSGQLMAEARVIYGEDDRRDLFDSDNDPKMVALARSTAILVKKSDLTPEGSRFKLPTETFGEAMNLCDDEPFFEQPTPGFCSGFLVGDDLLVTAGHCIRDAEMCAGVNFVFDFGYDQQGKDLTTVDAADVYSCKSIVSQTLEGGQGNDYAVIKLDRTVTDREPLKLNRSRALKVGDGVTVIGHPSGLPTKITSKAKVRTNDAAKPYFVANLDTYGGNSGSAVFNTTTGEVEGILVRGETDFTYRGSCTISNRCVETGCRGEDVTRVNSFARHVPTL